MADIELRKRLATVAGVVLDNDLLDSIYARLVGADGEANIPVTIKYNFRVDKDGVMWVEIASRCNLLLQRHALILTSDGNQLMLPLGEKKRVTAPAIARAKPTKKTAKKKKAAAKVDAAIGSGAGSRAEKRLLEIQRQNEEMFAAGTITRAQAEAAGVDVGAVEESRSAATILTDEEKEAIANLVI